MAKMYTVGCWNCGEYHAYRTLEEAEDKLEELRSDRQPFGHTHNGLSVVLVDEDKLW